MTQKQNTPRVAPLWRGIISDFLKFLSMKKLLKSAPVFWITLTTVTLTFFTSLMFNACRPDTEEIAASKSKGEWSATARSSCSSGYCEFTIVAGNNCTVEVCGDITSSASGCNFGCNTLGDDRTDTFILFLSDDVSLCVDIDGSICLRNPSTASTNAILQVYFEGTSTPVNVTIPPGEVRCFHTNSSCATIGGC